MLGTTSTSNPCRETSLSNFLTYLTGPGGVGGWAWTGLAQPVSGRVAGFGAATGVSAYVPSAPRDRRVGARRLKGTICRHAAHWNVLYTTGFCNYGEVATYITFSDLDFATTGGTLNLRSTYMEERGPRKVTLRLESHKRSEPKGLIIKLRSTKTYNIWLRRVAKGLIMALAFSGLLLWLHCGFREVSFRRPTC